MYLASKHIKLMMHVQHYIVELTPSSCITLQERRESVLVAAHTSAGKTAVAE